MSQQSNSHNFHRIINCTVGDEVYCLEMSWIKSILRIDRMRQHQFYDSTELGTSFPIKDVFGWVMVSGKNIPVFRLSKILKRPVTEYNKNDITFMRIIVLQDPAVEDYAWGLLVDRVSPVIQILDEDLSKLPPIFSRFEIDIFQGVIRQGEKINLLLRPKCIDPRKSDGVTVELLPSVAVDVDETGSKDAAMLDEDSQEALTWTKGDSLGRIMVFSPLTLRVPGRPVSFGLSISQITEILRPLPLIPVPMAPSHLLGLVLWRSNSVPVITLESLLGMDTDEEVITNDKETRLLIAQAAGHEGFVGLQIQVDIRALKLPISYSASRRALTINRQLTSAIVELADETLVIPDMQKVLDVETGLH